MGYDGAMALRLPSSEKAKIKEDADLAGLNMSEMIRRRYFGRPIVAHADIVLIKELRRIGGLVKHIHNESKGAYSNLTADILKELNHAITRVANPEHDH